MNVYEFLMKSYKVKEIRLHLWSNDLSGNEVCKHMTFTDVFDSRIYALRDYNVVMFNCVKKDVIEIIASTF